MRRLGVAARATMAAACLAVAGPIAAAGIVNKIVNSPLSATGLVRDAHVGINIYLHTDAAQDLEFMDPGVIGYGIPAGGRIEIEMARGFERVSTVPLTQKTIMVVTGTPQQGMPGKAVGYEVAEGANPNTIVLQTTKPDGLNAEELMSPAPGAEDDPVRQRGIKIFHVGLLESPFVNRGESGTINVRIIDGADTVVHQGSASVEFLDAPVPQIQPNNFPDNQRNHNWQVVKSGETLGKTPGTLPIPIMLYDFPREVSTAEMSTFKKGLYGVGVLSTQQLLAMEYEKPAAIARYNGGLIVQDWSGDGVLDPKADRIVGGIIGKAPAGAKGQELRSLDLHGAVDLSRPSTAYHATFGNIFGGAIALLQFTAGDKAGLYRPTLALLSDPDDLASSDGSAYTYTIVVK